MNHQIRAPRIRVVLEDGSMLGVMSPQEAFREAEKRGLDVVEISPKAVPPVCKLMDFGKFKYEQKKKTQNQKKGQPGKPKEITLSPQTDQHDLDFKMKNSARFLSEGYRVKVVIRFRGREMAHPEIGQRQMQKVIESLKAHGVLDGDPKMEGRLLMAIFAPTSQAGKKTSSGLDNSLLPPTPAPKTAVPKRV